MDPVVCIIFLLLRWRDQLSTCLEFPLWQFLFIPFKVDWRSRNFAQSYMLALNQILPHYLKWETFSIVSCKYSYIIVLQFPWKSWISTAFTKIDQERFDLKRETVQQTLLQFQANRSLRWPYCLRFIKCLTLLSWDLCPTFGSSWKSFEPSNR